MLIPSLPLPTFFANKLSFNNKIFIFKSRNAEMPKNTDLNTNEGSILRLDRCNSENFTNAPPFSFCKGWNKSQNFWCSHFLVVRKMILPFWKSRKLIAHFGLHLKLSTLNLAMWLNSISSLKHGYLWQKSVCVWNMRKKCIPTLVRVRATGKSAVEFALIDLFYLCVHTVKRQTNKNERKTKSVLHQSFKWFLNNS